MNYENYDVVRRQFLQKIDPEGSFSQKNFSDSGVR